MHILQTVGPPAAPRQARRPMMMMQQVGASLVRPRPPRAHAPERSCSVLEIRTLLVGKTNSSTSDPRLRDQLHLHLQLLLLLQLQLQQQQLLQQHR
jgi:hypothetical protein